MTDMIEKMARAIAEVEDYYQQTDDADDVWKTYIPHAKAALSALENPSEAQSEAGLRVVQYYAHEGRAMTDEWLANTIYRAMISQAAKGEAET